MNKNKKTIKLVPKNKEFILINPPTKKIITNKASITKEDFPSTLPIMRGYTKNIPPKRTQFKLTIHRVERPFNNDFEHQLAWVCSTMGFFEPIDKEKNAAAILKEIILATQRKEALSTTAIAERLGLSRGAVINHLNNLKRAGLIENNKKFYSARSNSVKRTIEEIEFDVARIFQQLKKSAEELDKQIGFG